MSELNLFAKIQILIILCVCQFMIGISIYSSNLTELIYIIITCKCHNKTILPFSNIIIDNYYISTLIAK